MPAGSKSQSSFNENIKKAVISIKEKNYVAAEDYIKNAMLENYHAPEVHNLLGILAELIGDLSLAAKHFRAAYALDPTYKPASRNLERIGSFYYKFRSAKPDFGDNSEEEEFIPYIIEYGKKNIGHLIKKGAKGNEKK